ncbi:hypothetical protein [Staphylococcus capitis]|uniref:hypothetical protein n=1 Tax=Staphylococcus capitis TaxID=29388 RepID=UPI003D06E938
MAIFNRSVPVEPSAEERANAKVNVLAGIDLIIALMAAQPRPDQNLIDLALEKRSEITWGGAPAIRPSVPVIPGPMPLPQRHPGGARG